MTLTGFFISLSGSILFSTKAIMVKLAFNGTPTDALTLLMLRMLFALPFYLLIAFWAAKKENSQPLTSKQWLQIAGLGIIGYYLSSLFDFIGLQYVSAGLERLILFLYPTFSVIINAKIFKTSLTKIQIAALILTYVGIGIAYFGELKIDNTNPNFYFGSGMILLCAITYSLYLVGTGRIVKKVGDTRYTAYAMLFATLGIFIHFALKKPINAVVLSPQLLWLSIGLAIIATVVPSFLISNAMKKIGSNNVSIISSIGPVSTIIQAHFILGEQLFAEQLIGTLLVIAGVLLIGWKSSANNTIA